MFKASLFPVLVVVAAALVYVPQLNAGERVQISRLPQHVAEVRDAILAAARSGNIEELASAFEVSRSTPDLGIADADDPIAALKAKSGETQGREILAALVEILNMPPAALPLGRDIENNLIYIWPYLAVRPLDKLTPAETVDLYRLVTPEEAVRMREKKRWLWWRLVVAADGTWLSLKRAE
jgi:hypothetical protein